MMHLYSGGAKRRSRSQKIAATSPSLAPIYHDSSRASPPFVSTRAASRRARLAARGSTRATRIERSRARACRVSTEDGCTMTSSGARTDAKNKRNRGRVSAILTSPRPMATPSRAPGTPVQAPPPLALRVALRERYAGTFVDTLKDSNAKHARERPVDWLEREIEACYDARLEEDVRTLRSLLNETTATSSGAVEGDSSASVVNGEEAEEESQSFSDGGEYWGRAFGVKALIEKHLWEVVSNAEAARKSKKSECAELFCAFLRRSYDEEALLFFLYCEGG